MLPQLLVAEDDEGSREALEMLLKNDFRSVLEIVAVPDGKQAIEKIRQGTDGQILSVLSDFNMPYSDGIEVVTAAFDAKIPTVVLMTARDSSSLIQMCGEDGKEKVDALLDRGLGLIRKPLSIDEVIQKAIDPIRRFLKN